jgi:hypothetical protein
LIIAGDRDLTLGSFLAALLIFGFIFAAGYLSLAAQWVGLVPAGTPPYAYIFSVFEPVTRPAVLHNWIGVVVIIAAATFSQVRNPPSCFAWLFDYGLPS